MKSEHQKRVEDFMAKAGQVVPDTPTMPDEETRWLRAKLILEEAFETAEGLGFVPSSWISYDRQMEINKLQFNFRKIEPDLNEIIDGCCDVKVVTTGTLSACGIPDEPFQQAVDENNLAKFGPGGYRREDGKWVKPAGHKPPDIAGILASLSTAQQKEGAA